MNGDRIRRDWHKPRKRGNVLRTSAALSLLCAARSFLRTLQTYFLFDNRSVESISTCFGGQHPCTYLVRSLSTGSLYSPNVLLSVIVHLRRARSDVTREPLPDYLRFERYLTHIRV